MIILNSDVFTQLKQITLRHYPKTEALYLFGSYADKQNHDDSDIDLALLLPAPDSQLIGSLAMSECRFEFEDMLKITVDLINLRQVSTVFQKEIVSTATRLFTQRPYQAEEFEMLVYSFYQKLNQERADILQAFQMTGRAYQL